MRAAQALTAPHSLLHRQWHSYKRGALLANLACTGLSLTAMSSRAGFCCVVVLCVRPPKVAPKPKATTNKFVSLCVCVCVCVCVCKSV